MADKNVAACMYVWQLSFIHATETYTIKNVHDDV